MAPKHTPPLAIQLMYQPESFARHNYISVASICDVMGNSSPISEGINKFRFQEYNAYEIGGNGKLKENTGFFNNYFSTSPKIVSLETANDNGNFTDSFQAYWVPQGKSFPIPITPNEHQPKFLFTPDFSGCSLIIDKLNSNSYQVYHVTSGDVLLDREYLNSNINHGLGQVEAVHFDDYGEHNNEHGTKAFMFMAYNSNIGKWCIYTQKQSGVAIKFTGGKCSYVAIPPSVTGVSIRPVTPHNPINPVPRDRTPLSNIR